MLSKSNKEVKTINKGKGLKQKQAARAFYLFIAPLFSGLIIFKVIPIIWGFILSFYDAKYTIGFNEYVGISNYVKILTNDAFLRSLMTGMLFVIFIVPVTYVASLFLAFLINNVKRGRSFFRMTFFLPTACSYVLASMIWRYSLFNGMFFGLANKFISLFGFSPIAWTSNVPQVWVVLVTVRLWLQSGFYMILFLAALQDIPESLYEAGRVDGIKSKWQEIWYISFPLLRNISVVVIILNIINGFMAFAEFYNILGGTQATGGANLYLVRPPLVYLFMNSLTSLDYGVGSAGSFILTAIIITITLLQSKILGFGRSDRNKGV